jgi:aryl-alcohol dehydrogenase-like predicted oxidoreductase
MSTVGHGIGFVPYSPLGRGFLTDNITDIVALRAGDARRNMPRFQGGNLHRNLELVETLRKCAVAEKCTPEGQEDVFPKLIASGEFADIATVHSAEELLTQLQAWAIPIRRVVADTGERNPPGPPVVPG